MASAPPISDLLECPICLDILNDPKILDCQHTFCAKCLEQYQKRSASMLAPASFINCPVCRIKTNLLNYSVDSLPGNYIVRDIIERHYGRSPPERPAGYSKQIRDRIDEAKKEENQSDWLEYVKPAAAALVGVLGGLLLAKGISKMTEKEKK